MDNEDTEAVADFNPVAAAFSGFALLFGKPWVVLAWLVATVPLAAAAVGALTFVKAIGLINFGALYYGGVMILAVLSIPAIILDGAAYRSVMAPEKSHFFYLSAGLGVLGRSVSGYARSTQPTNQRLRWWMLLPAGALFVTVMATGKVSDGFHIPRPVMTWAMGASIAWLAVVGMIVFVRHTFVHIAALTSRRTWDPVQKSWLFTEGHVGQLFVMHAITLGIWAAASAAALWGAWRLIDPAGASLPWDALWNAVPDWNAQGWRGFLSLPCLALVGAVTIIAVVREVICDRATAVAYMTVRRGRTDLSMPAYMASM